MKSREDLAALHGVLLEILEQIIRICDEENINYFIIGGTALGAVRHKGFIPWDDDLDIGMLRSDYERFLAAAQVKLSSGYFLQTHATDKESPFYFSKVRKNGTVFKEDYVKNLDIHHGIYIDIFPFDPIPDKMFQRFFYHLIVKILFRIYISKFVTGASIRIQGFKGKMKCLLREVLNVFLKPVPVDFLYRVLDKEMQRYKGKETRYSGFVPIPVLRAETDSLQDTCSIEFENIIVKCPSHIKRYLRLSYGDYMVLPPINERLGHNIDQVEL